MVDRAYVLYGFTLYLLYLDRTVRCVRVRDQSKRKVYTVPRARSVNYRTLVACASSSVNIYP